MDKDYTIFVHFRRGRDIVFQNDHKPIEGLYNTSQWPEGEKVKEGYEVSAPRDIEAGMYKIIIGLWDPKKGERLKVKGEKGKDEVEMGKGPSR